MEKGSGLVRGAGNVTSGFYTFWQMRAYWKREQRFLVFGFSVSAFKTPGHYRTKMEKPLSKDTEIP
jgi:hypothetical protein